MAEASLIELADCRHCGVLARVVDHFLLAKRDGSLIESKRIACFMEPKLHRSVMPVAELAIIATINPASPFPESLNIGEAEVALQQQPASTS